MKCHEHDRYIYKSELKELLEEDQDIWNACLEEIEKRKELRHKRVMERQIRKFNKLLSLKNSREEQDQQGGCSKHQSDCSKEQGPQNKESAKNNERTKKWVINLSSIPLTKDQENLLAHGPNFAVTPQKPPWGNI